MNDSSPLLVDTGRGLSVSLRGRWLYSRRDPAAAPSAAAASAAAAMLPETLYLVPSPCLCYGIGILASALPPSSAILCLEAEEELLSLATDSLPAAFRGTAAASVALARAARAVEAYRALESGPPARRFRRVVEVRLSGGRSLREKAYDEALASIDADLSLRHRNRLSLVRMGRLWLKNVIDNVGAMDWASVGPLDAGGRAVIACGAGPSLAGAMELIRTRRRSLFVLACDTACGALAAGGVRPDAVVCLEGQVYNVEDFIPLDRASAAAVVDLSAHPSSFRAFRGRKTLVLSEWTESPFLTRLAGSGLPLALVPPLGSVGVLALRIASVLGGPVLFTGLDFSFPQGATHCVGTPADRRARRSESRLEKRSAAWAASFRDGSRRLPDGSVTDPALSLYASLAAGELRAAKEAYDLRGGFGAPLPCPSPSAEELDELILRGNASGGSFGRGADPAWCARAAQGFLRGELGRATGVAEALRHGADGASLGKMLAEADFLYAHFPDPERVAALQPDALRRVSAEAAYWSGRLESAIETSARP